MKTENMFVKNLLKFQSAHLNAKSSQINTPNSRPTDPSSDKEEDDRKNKEPTIMTPNSNVILNNTLISLQSIIEKGNETKLEINRDYKLTAKQADSLWFDY